MSSQIDILSSDITNLSDYMALVNIVGWPHTAKDIISLLILGRPWRAVDRESREVIGVAVWWPMGRDWGRVGLVIVSPKFQGQGIGRSLMKKVLLDAGARSLMLLATEEGRPLYNQLGFKSVGLTQRHQGYCSHDMSTEPGIQSASLKDLTEIIALDATVTGFDRSPMITQMFGVGNTTILREKNKIIGYAIRRSFGLGTTLGPLIARNEDCAKKLFMASVNPGVLRIDRILRADKFGQFLEAQTIPGNEISHSMVRGTKPSGSGNCHLFAMASHAWG
jgi:GNAT superfamily N-acetyltransferase